MARIALAVAGAAIGFLIGGPLGLTIGSTIGSALGAVLFPGKLPPGPRLNDLIVTSATNGAPIPIVYGTTRIAGNMIWATPIQEQQKTQSVKGGPKQTTYTYFGNFACAFCEGPATIGRIWFDSKLVYDPNNGSAFISAISESGNTVTVTSILNPNIGDQVTIAGAPPGYNGKFQVLLSSPVNFTYYNPNTGLSAGSGGTASVPAPTYAAPTIYSGSESQNADPSIQAVQGAANTPAFRGICYAVWTNFPLANFGNRVPNIRAEVSTTTSGSTSIAPVYVQALNATISNSPGSIFGGSASFASNTTQGNIMLALVSSSDLGNNGNPNDPVAQFTLSDNQGNNWTPIAPSGVNAAYSFFTGVGSGFSAQMFIAYNIKGGPCTLKVVATYTNSVPVLGLQIKALELTGNGVNPVVQTGYYASTGGGNINTTPFVNLGTYGPGQLVIALCPQHGSSASPGNFTNPTGIASGIFFWSEPTPITQNYIVPIQSGGSSNNSDNCMFAVVLANAYPSNGTTYPLLLTNIVQDICTRCGLALTDIDTTPLLTLPGSSPVVVVAGPSGYVLSRPTTGQEALKPLAQAFFFDGVESNGLLRFIPRGEATQTLTVPESDLGWDKDKFKLTESFGMAQDLPREIDVMFNDKALDYQQNKGQKRRHTKIVRTKQQSVYEFPMVLDSTAARQIGEKMLFIAYLERKLYDINLWKALYMLFDPTDIINFTYEGLSFTLRIVKVNLGADFTVQISGVNENANNYLSSVAGSSGVYSPVHGQTIPDTALFLFDIPLLRDSDSNPTGSGYYFAMSAVAASKWPGATLNKSSDNVNFTLEGQSSLSASYGTVVGAPLPAPPGSPWVWDTTSSLRIAMTQGILSGSTDLAVLNGANALLLGNGEVIQFVNSVTNSDGSFTISRFLRGRRGTDTTCGTHGPSELVVALTAPGMVRIPANLSNIQVLRYYRAVTYGGDITQINSTLFTNTAADLKPYAPASLAGSRDGSGNLTLIWIRRTRIGGDWLEGNGTVPLSETTESYDVEIVNSSGTVVRTFAGQTSPTASYTAAQQVSDFGSTQSKVTFNVYQNSGVIGRGYKATATV